MADEHQVWFNIAITSALGAAAGATRLGSTDPSQLFAQSNRPVTLFG